MSEDKEGTLINTVDDKRYSCTVKEYCQDQLSRNIKNIIGRP